jgi:hypothetical protein
MRLQVTEAMRIKVSTKCCLATHRLHLLQGGTQTVLHYYTLNMKHYYFCGWSASGGQMEPIIVTYIITAFRRVGVRPEFCTVCSSKGEIQFQQIILLGAKKNSEISLWLSKEDTKWSVHWSGKRFPSRPATLIIACLLACSNEWDPGSVELYVAIWPHLK